MWYKKNFRRHLCDMHIDDWNDEFLSKFNSDDYLNNLKLAKIKSAMIYFQSHVGLCYYPTKTGKIHKGFVGKENEIKRLTELCRANGIAVTGYYSLIYNTWAHDVHPEWRMVTENGKSRREIVDVLNDCSEDDYKTARYGLCCPNNPDYRKFIAEQIKEIANYFKVDGMFYDMLFWPHMCYCDSCKKRWANEVGGELPIVSNWNDERWLLHIQKRREWMGEFASWVTDFSKKLMPDISVEHNVAYSALPDDTTANGTEVISACDYAGGDLYGDGFGQSFACKFYRSVTNNQPFEYMFSRCAPNLAAHTQIKSLDVMKSAVFLTAANHGATLIIDAVDPKGSMDSRVYERIGKVFDELIPYEQYLIGNPIEDIGIYYSLKSKFDLHGNGFTNYAGVLNTLKNLVAEHIPCGITGDFNELDKHKIVIASSLTTEDEHDNVRLINYVKNGGCLYFSGEDNPKLLKEFFNAEVNGFTKEKVVYIAPNKKVQKEFDYFNSDYPLNFEASVPICSGINSELVLATVTLPYTHQNTKQFVSIHANPPWTKTDIPAIAMTKYGKGKVMWSAAAIESVDLYDNKRIFIELIKSMFEFSSNVISNAAKDIEITLYSDKDFMLVNTVLINSDYKARKVEDFSVAVKCDNTPKKVLLLPKNTEIPFTFENGYATFNSKNMEIFNMYKIQF